MSPSGIKKTIRSAETQIAYLPGVLLKQKSAVIFSLSIPFLSLECKARRRFPPSLPRLLAEGLFLH